MTLPRYAFVVIVALAVLAGRPVPVRAQSTYTWSDATTDWSQPGAWTPSGPNWFERARMDDAIAAFGNQATIASQPTISTNSLFANGITIDNTGADWNLFGTGTLSLGSGGISLAGGGATTVQGSLLIAKQQAMNVGTGGTLVFSGALLGVSTLTKSGDGILVIDNSDNSFTGTIALAAGTLRVGGTNNAGGTAIRNTAIDFGSGNGILTIGGSGAHIRVGQLSGSSSGASIQIGSQIVHLTALQDATFSGTVSMEGLSVTGTATQTFNGNTTTLGGTVTAFGRSGVTLSGTGNITSGVLGAQNIVLRGGTFTLDNTGGNTGAANGRLNDNTRVTMVGGGTLRLIGNDAGTTEHLGLELGVTAPIALMFRPGANTIRVDHIGGSGGTEIGFNGGAVNFSLQGAPAMTVNFVGTGGTLGAAGANPRIVFTGAGQPTTGAVTGLLSDVAGSDATVGWATVNGTEWAGTGPNGIVAVGPNLTTGTSTGLQGASATSVALFNPNSNQSLSANVTSATLNIQPGATGLSLNIGGNNLNSLALMLAGPTNFTITASTGHVMNATSPRYVYVTDENTVLTLNGAAFSNGNIGTPLTKSGAGTLALTGSTHLLPFTTNQNIYVVQGTLRGTVDALSGPTGFGPFSNINLRGGVLEIDGDGNTGITSIFRALDQTPTANGGSIRFDAGALDQGDGGFSAFNAPGGVHVVLTPAVGTMTAATLQWGDGLFLASGHALLFGSPHSNSRIALDNAVQLDNGVAGTYVAREVHVRKGAGNLNDYAQLLDPISGSSSADLLKTGNGVLELISQNTYLGNTLVHEGTLVVGSGGSLGTGGNRTGNVVVGRGAVLAGTGSILTDINKSVVVNPGGAIRGGSPVTSDLAEHTGTLAVSADLTIHSTLADRGTIQFEFDRSAPNAGTASSIALAGGFNLNLNPGTGNQFALELVHTGVGDAPVLDEQYTVTLVTMSTTDQIRLNGVDLPDGVIAQSNYVLQSSSFTFDSGHSLFVETDGSGKHLRLSFAITPVPEPATALAIALGTLGLSRVIRRRR